MPLRLSIENISSLPDGGPVSFEVAGKRGLDIGRDQYLDWVLPDPNRVVSGKHCEVRYQDGSYWLRDVSTNGTFVNQNPRRLSEPHRLRHGDRVEVGHYIIRVELSGEEAQASEGGAPEGGGTWDVATAAPPVDPGSFKAPPKPHLLAADPLDHWLSHATPVAPPAPPPLVPPPLATPPADIWGDADPYGRAEPPPAPPRRRAQPLPADYEPASQGGGTNVVAPVPQAPQPMGVPPQQPAPPYGAAPAPAYDPQAYGASPQAPAYEAAPQPPYGQPPQAPPYEAAPQPPYGQPPQAPPYGQPPQAPPDGQPPQAPPYGQPPQAPPYGQPPQGSPYGQPPQAPPYGQPPQAPPYGQPPQAPPYGAPPSPVPPYGVAPMGQPPMAPPVVVAPPPAVGRAPLPRGDANAEFIRRFAEGAGIEPEIVYPRDAGDLAETLGILVQICAGNVAQLLAARAQSKSAMRSGNQTLIQLQGNNPLRWAPTPQDAMKLMFGRPTPSYVDACNAFERSFETLKNHQIDTFSSLQEAIQVLLADLDPAAIERAVGVDGKKGGLFGGDRAQKAKLWDEFQARWKSKTGSHDSGMFAAFMRVFGEAYDRKGD
jgi:type VI secretion system protein ImpI